MIRTCIGSLCTVVVTLVLGSGGAAQQQKPALAEILVGQALHQEEVEGDLEAAIATYKKIVADPQAARTLKATALLHIGRAYEKLGSVEARKAYERLTREYADQTQAAEARIRLAALDAKNGRDTRVVVQQVWSGADVDPFGSISSDGRLFAYVDWSARVTGNIAVRDLVTGETHYLTHATKAADGLGFDPTFSPDAKQVAYVWEQTKDTGTSIQVASVDGSGTRVLAQKPGFGIHDLRWSPNGRQLGAVLVDYPHDRTSQIALISLTDGRMTQLKSLGWDGAALGGFSSDGRYVVYSIGFSPSSTDSGIYTLAVDGSREARLVHSEAKESAAPVWTPDGGRVAFVSNRSGTDDLWSIRVSDGKAVGDPELLRANIGAVANMGFTRTGALFYGAINNKRDVYACDIDPTRPEIVSRPTRLSNTFIGSNAGAAWSPDGKFVAFFRGVDRRAMSLVIRALDDGTERVVPTKVYDSILAGNNGPVWTPDGRAVLLPENDYGHNVAKVRKIDIESGLDQVLVEASDMWPVARISVDGKTLYYTKVEKTSGPDTQILHLMARELDGGRETDLFHTESDGVGFFSMAVSPDGSQIALMANEGKEPGKERTLMTVPTSGGPRASSSVEPTAIPALSARIGHATVATFLRLGRRSRAKDACWRFRRRAAPLAHSTSR